LKYKKLKDDPVLKLNRTEEVGAFLFRFRDFTPVPLVLTSVLFARPQFVGFVIGAILALLGQWFRAYGVAFIGSVSRTRGYSNGEIVDSGPFSMLRNPLYLANFILSLGLSVMTGLYWMPLLVVIAFFVQYIPIVAWEEKKLFFLFGQRYLKYQQDVPNRWIPSLPKIKALLSAKQNINWKMAIASEKRTLTAVVCYFVTMIALFIIRS
jgi:protein-S-isoprenylcysteine O-methyltransferase Ste14